MALATGHDADVGVIDRKLEEIRTSFDRKYWKGSYYMSSQVTTPDDRANAMAVNVGLADRSKWASIYDQVLTKKAYASCFSTAGSLRPSAPWGNRTTPCSACTRATRQ